MHFANNNFIDYNADGSKKRKSEKEEANLNQSVRKRTTVSWSDGEDLEESNSINFSFKETKGPGVEILISIPGKTGSKKYATCVALLNSGISSSLIDAELVEKMKKKN